MPEMVPGRRDTATGCMDALRARQWTIGHMPGDSQTLRTASELVAAWLLDMEVDHIGDPDGEYRAALVRTLEELPMGEVPDTGPLMVTLVEMLAVAVGGIAGLRGTSPRHELGQLLLRFEPIIDPPTSSS